MIENSETEKELWAYIIETDEIVKYSAATSANYYDNGCPESWKDIYSRDKYLGSGYICYYDICGNLYSSDRLLYFYK